MAVLTSNDLLAAIRSLPLDERVRIIGQATRDIEEDTPRSLRGVRGVHHPSLVRMQPIAFAIGAVDGLGHEPQHVEITLGRAREILGESGVDRGWGELGYCKTCSVRKGPLPGRIDTKIGYHSIIDQR
jgi:hypothetical protein